jgi:hypothetical protein
MKHGLQVDAESAPRTRLRVDPHDSATGATQGITMKAISKKSRKNAQEEDEDVDEDKEPRSARPAWAREQVT